MSTWMQATRRYNGAFTSPENAQLKLWAKIYWVTPVIHQKQSFQLRSKCPWKLNSFQCFRRHFSLSNIFTFNQATAGVIKSTVCFEHAVSKNIRRVLGTSTKSFIRILPFQ